MELISDEISEIRRGLCRQAVNYVERSCDQYVQEQLSRLARLNPNGDHRLTSAVHSHLAVLFAGVTDTEGAANRFLDIIIPILDQAENDELASASQADEAPAQGWSYWLAKYRECLDAVRVQFGLPGHFFSGRRRVEFRTTRIPA